MRHVSRVFQKNNIIQILNHTNTNYTNYTGYTKTILIILNSQE